MAGQKNYGCGGKGFCGIETGGFGASAFMAGLSCV